MIKAYVENDVVKEICRVDPTAVFQLSYAAQFIDCPDDVVAGWLYSDGVFSAPPAPPPPSLVPQSVTRFQALAALQNAGLLTTVQAAVITAPALVQIAWANAATFERTSPTLAGLTTGLGMTSDQVDALFIAAAQITA